MATAEVASVQSALQVQKIEEPIKIQETTTEEAPSAEPVADEPKDEVTEAEPEAQEPEVDIEVKHFDRQYCKTKWTSRLLDDKETRRGPLSLPQPYTFKPPSST